MALSLGLIVIWIILFFYREDNTGIASSILGVISMGCLFASSWSSLRQIRKTRYQDIYFAGGCFWGTEKYFKLVKGVVETEVGYANGNTESPTYEQVYTDTTGYAECVHVRFDTEVTTVRRLTEMFFKAIDPTSVNQHRPRA